MYMYIVSSGSSSLPFLLADGLAVDWLSDKLYWTDMLWSHVTVASLDGANRMALFSGLEKEKPCGLVVDPTTRYERRREWRGRGKGSGEGRG